MGFWDQAQGAAIFKHAILRQYAPIFVNKVGRRSPANRVEILDGYAGQGWYNNGDPGSPAVFLETAELLKNSRQVHCTFIEEDPRTFAKLKEMLDQTGVPHERATILPGTMSEHLDEVLQRAEGVPLFVFVDPFGLGLPFEELVGKLMRPQARQAPTEVLFSFIRSAVYRQIGLLHPETTNLAQLRAARSKVIELDRDLGGDWWRKLEGTSADRLVSQVRDGYIDHIQEACPGLKVLQVPVADMTDYKPVYDLLFFTRHDQGRWFFNDAVSLARPVFADHCNPTGFMRPQLFTPDAEWEAEIATNLRQLLAQKGQVFFLRDMVQIYGGTLGKARGKHVKAAARKLVTEGVAEGETKSDPHLIKLRAKRLRAVS